MKIKALLIVLSVAVSAKTFAQIELGLKAGVNIATVNTVGIPNAENLEYKSIASPVFGVATRIHINEKFNLDSDFLFSTRGYQIFGYKTTISYLELPVVVSYMVAPNLDLQLGPDFNFKILTNSDEPQIGQNTFEFIEFGGIGGLRYTLADKLFISARYYYGLTSIATLYRTSSADSKTFNRNLQLTVGYRLPVRRKK